MNHGQLPQSVLQFFENRNEHSMSPVTNVMEESLPENTTLALPGEKKERKKKELNRTRFRVHNTNH
jgi:hypothetical protein